MGRKKLSEEERIRRRRERDRLRKRRQRKAQKRESEIAETFLAEVAGVKPKLPDGDHTDKKGTNPDRVKRCPRCKHYLPFCTCARDSEGKLKDDDGWLTSPVG
jgi:hypothetical protein